MYRKRKRIYAVAMFIIIAAAILLQSINLNNDERVTKPYTEDENIVMTQQDAAPYAIESRYQLGNAHVGALYARDNQKDNMVEPDVNGDGTFAMYQNPLDSETEKEIDDIISDMTLEEKVGQMFFIKNDGRFKSDIIANYPVGGIILFDGDLKGKSAKNLTDNIASFQSVSKYPLLIGVDEEGGTVIRLSKYSTYAAEPFSSPRTIYNSGGMEAVNADTAKKSELLLSYGINVNFAPVCDVSGDSSDFIYSRSISGDADVVSDFAAQTVAAMKDENIGSVLKHFPGYGSNGDTHTDVVRDTRDYSTFESVDFKPFQAGIEAGADCILINHNIVECMDSEKPASLSYNVHKVLRTELGFKGVIITDDLMMNGVSEFEDEASSAVSAVLAGNDMILSTYYDVQYQAVLDAVRDGRISEERVETSVRRILRWKYTIGIMPDM